MFSAREIDFDALLALAAGKHSLPLVGSIIHTTALHTE